MTLYRMVYAKPDGRTAGATFAAMDAHHAHERAQDWAARWRVTLLTVNLLNRMRREQATEQPQLFPA